MYSDREIAVAFPHAETRCLKSKSALKTAESQMMLLILGHTEGLTRTDPAHSLQKCFLEGGGTPVNPDLSSSAQQLPHSHSTPSQCEARDRFSGSPGLLAGAGCPMYGGGCIPFPSGFWTGSGMG